MLLSVADIFTAVGALPKLLAAIQEAKQLGADHESLIGSIVTDIPELLPIIEKVANYIYPGAGTAIEVLAWVMHNSRPMTPQEEALWFDRQTGGQ